MIPEKYIILCLKNIESKVTVNPYKAFVKSVDRNKCNR